MEWEWGNLSDAVFHYAEARPDAPAIHEGGRVVTYREFAELIGKATVFLNDAGVKRDELVGLALPTTLDHLVLLFALMRIGAVPVDVPLHRPSAIDPFQRFGITRVLASPEAGAISAPHVSIVDANFQKLIAPSTGDYRYGGSLDTTYQFSITSGSTGGPKGVLTTQRQWNARFRTALALFPDVLTPERPPNLLVLGEMSFSGFFFFLANQIYIGGPAVLVGVVPDLKSTIEAIKAWDDSVFLITPSIARDMLAVAPADAPLFPQMRALFVGAAPLFADEKRTIKRRLAANFYEVYGNAATGFIAALRPDEIDNKAGTVGRPAPDVTIEVVDFQERPAAAGSVGHLRCRGAGISERFFGTEAVNAGPEGFRDGWYYPGDIGMIDEDGFVVLKGRTGDLIRRRGVEIYAPEIEEALTRHAGVAEAAVVPVTIPGQEVQIIAVVVLRAEVKLEAVADHCRETLPPEKFPTQLFWTEKLPRTGPGKVDRATLAAHLQSQLAQKKT